MSCCRESGDELQRPANAESDNRPEAAVEFFCPEVALEAATFNVDVGIKRRGSRPAEFVDCKRAAVLNVTIGKRVAGAFYTPHTWRLEQTNSVIANDLLDADLNLVRSN